MAAVVIGARNRGNLVEPSDADTPVARSPPGREGAAVGARRQRQSSFVEAQDDDSYVRRMRLAVWNALGDPSSSTLAYIFFSLILSLILVSCVAFVVETIPSYCCGRYSTTFSIIEWVCVIAFTFEYLARFAVVPADVENEGMFACEAPTGLKAELLTRLRFFLKPFNLVDFAAIFPSYITAIVEASGSESSGPLDQTSFLRVIRLARVFRLFKLSKYSDGMWLLTATLIRSWRALGMLSFFMLISVILFSSIMYFVEKGRFFYCTTAAVNASPPLCLLEDIWDPSIPTLGENMQAPLERCGELATAAYLNSSDFPLKCCDGEGFYVWPPLDSDANGCLDRSAFDSIFSTAWWCVVTMTTVGYGDSYPVTTEGKILACLTMLSGILILALPITVIGSNFNIEYEKSEAEARMKRQLELSQQQEGETASEHPQHAAAAHMSAGSRKALLGAVEKLLSDQREIILKRADDMIVQHVREIAKEVVAQSQRAAHTPGSPSQRPRQTSGVGSRTPATPGRPATGEVAAPDPFAGIPAQGSGGAGAAGGNSSRGSQSTQGAAGAAETGPETSAAGLPSMPNVT